MPKPRRENTNLKMNITRKLSDLIVQIMYQIQWEKKWPDNAERNLLKLIVVEVLNKLEVRYWNTNDKQALNGFISKAEKAEQDRTHNECNDQQIGRQRAKEARNRLRSTRHCQ